MNKTFVLKFYCEITGCDEECLEIQNSNISDKALEILLKHQGWKLINDKWSCPVCSKKLMEAK